MNNNLPVPDPRPPIPVFPLDKNYSNPDQRVRARNMAVAGFKGETKMPVLVTEGAAEPQIRLNIPG